MGTKTKRNKQNAPHENKKSIIYYFSQGEKTKNCLLTRVRTRTTTKSTTRLKRELDTHTQFDIYIVSRRTGWRRNTKHTQCETNKKVYQLGTHPI